MLPFLEGLAFGLCELWPPSEKVRQHGYRVDIYDMLDLILKSHLDFEVRYVAPAPVDRILKSFVFCLRNGASPEALAHHRFSDGHDVMLPSYWHLLLWTSIHTSKFYVSPESLYMLFLLYGASPNFWLKFDDSHDHEEYRGLVLVAGLYGLE